MEKLGGKLNSIRSPEGKTAFEEHVEYEGLPYLFKGDLDIPEKDVSLELYISNWKDEIDKIPNNIGAPWELMHEGMIGSISLSPNSGDHGETYMDRVRSHTQWLPVDSKYRNAHVGRFMMDNLLAIADMNGWSMYAFPYADGKLSNEDVLQWLARKGFDMDGERKAQQADAGQPILKILQKMTK